MHQVENLQLDAHFREIGGSAHHSYVINTRKIKKIEEHQVYIQEKLIPVSEKYRETFYELIQRRSI